MAKKKKKSSTRKSSKRAVKVTNRPKLCAGLKRASFNRCLKTGKRPAGAKRRKH